MIDQKGLKDIWRFLQFFFIYFVNYLLFSFSDDGVANISVSLCLLHNISNIFCHSEFVCPFAKGNYREWSSCLSNTLQQMYYKNRKLLIFYLFLSFFYSQEAFEDNSAKHSGSSIFNKERILIVSYLTLFFSLLKGIITNWWYFINICQYDLESE